MPISRGLRDSHPAPMSVVEETIFGGQIGEAGATKAVGFPVDAHRRRGPMIVREERPVAFGDLAVESGVMRDGDVTARDELLERRAVDVVTPSASSLSRAARASILARVASSAASIRRIAVRPPMKLAWVQSADSEADAAPVRPSSPSPRRRSRRRRRAEHRFHPAGAQGYRVRRCTDSWFPNRWRTRCS
jgi:hypothetical protein